VSANETLGQETGLLRLGFTNRKIAKRMPLSAAMEFIWKRDKLNDVYDPIINNSKHFSTSVYNQFQDGSQIK
jgi:hypothetical protein